MEFSRIGSPGPAPCSCGGGEGAARVEDRLERLTERYRDLAQRMAEYMEDAPADREGRNRRAVAQAEELFRILGGRLTQDGAFPECCLVGTVSAGGFLQDWSCTGTLIHPRVVLTARHCILSASRLLPNAVALGVNRTSQLGAGSEAVFPISRILKHPTEDLALLILRRESLIEPAHRATPEELTEAERVLLVGFGNSDPGGSMGFGKQRRVTVPRSRLEASSEAERREAEELLGFDFATEFVAGRKGSGMDSCNGDSGGPAYVFVDGERALAGVTSRATDEAMNRCGDGGIYVRVPAQKAWIDGVLATLEGS